MNPEPVGPIIQKLKLIKYKRKKKEEDEYDANKIIKYHSFEPSDLKIILMEIFLFPPVKISLVMRSDYVIYATSLI